MRHGGVKRLGWGLRPMILGRRQSRWNWASCSLHMSRRSTRRGSGGGRADRREPTRDADAPASSGPEVWIALVEVRPHPGNDELEGAVGAFTNVVTHARDAASYADSVGSAFA